MKVMQLTVGVVGTNCYIVYDEATREAAVIDPGDNAKSILHAVAEEKLTVRYVLLTHAHFDHTGALRALHEALPAVPIYVHPADTDETRNMSHGNLIYTDTYEEGDTVRAGALEFTVLETPGHTPGSVTLRCGGALFTGDTLFAGSCGRTDFDGGSAEQMRASLRRLGQLPGDLSVYPGHGESSTLSYERRQNLYLREAMRP